MAAGVPTSYNHSDRGGENFRLFWTNYSIDTVSRQGRLDGQLRVGATLPGNRIGPSRNSLNAIDLSTPVDTRNDSLPNTLLEVIDFLP